MIIAIIVDEPKPKYEYTLVYRIHYSNYYKEYVAKSDEEIEYGYSFWRYTINFIYIIITKEKLLLK